MVTLAIPKIPLECKKMLYLQTVNDVFDHDVLQGEIWKPGPMLENPGVEAAGIVASEEHCLKIRTTIGWNNDN